MFLLNLSQQALREELRQFTDQHLMPIAQEIDLTKSFPPELLQTISNVGYPALPFPETLGGKGLSSVEGLIFIEEISRASASLGITYTANTFQVCLALLDAVTEQQKQAWLIPAIRGKKLLALALSEQIGGSDAFAVNTYAEETADGWVLNGSKYWITNVGLASGYLVAAYTSHDSRSRDIGLFYVDAQTPGLDDHERIETSGLRAASHGTILFRDCRIPRENYVGIPGTDQSSYHLIKRALNTGRAAISATAIGLAVGAYESAVAYTKERKYYGRAVANHQGVSFPVAEMATKISVAQHMMYHVGDLIDSGKPNVIECAQLKLFATEMCREVCLQAAELYGAAGYDQRSDISRMLRDSQMLTTAVGTSQICKVIISNHIYKY